MGKVRTEVFEDFVIEGDPGRIFRAWMDVVVILPKLMPDTFTETNCIQGDHKQAGGIVELRYPPGRAAFTRKCTCARDVYQYPSVDYGKNLHTYEFLEGEIKDKCNYFKGTVEVVPAQELGKTVVKHTVEFELIDVNDTYFSTALQERLALTLFHKISDYLKANPTEYV